MGRGQQLKASLGLWCPLQTEAIYPLRWVLSGWTCCSNHLKPVVYNWSILPIYSPWSTFYKFPDYLVSNKIILNLFVNCSTIFVTWNCHDPGTKDTGASLAQTWGTHQVLGTDGLPFLAGCHHHFAQSLSHVFQGTGEGQDSHDFTGHRDIKLGLLEGKRHNRENFVKPQQWIAKVILVCIHSLNESLNG